MNKPQEPTTGPWSIEVWTYSHATSPRKELKIQTPELLLATVECDFTGENPYTVPMDEAKRNAQLMAASKVMYEALKFVESRLTKSGYPDGPNLITIRHAIAQAEGK